MIVFGGSMSNVLSSNHYRHENSEKLKKMCSLQDTFYILYYKQP